MKTAPLALAVALLSSTAWAQSTPSYEPWQAGPDRLQEMVRDLDAIVSQGERDRAGSPAFLADLRALVERYETVVEPPVPQEAPAETPESPAAATPAAAAAPLSLPGRTIASDSFADGDYTAAPAWTVAQGDWTATPGEGLASDSRGAGDGDLAAIFLEQAIPNAFTIGFDLEDRANTGQIEIRVYQGTTRESGYRLVYRPDGAPSFALYRVGRGGVTQIAQTAAPVALPAEGAARIGWERAPGGAMTVTVDGAPVLQAADTGFREGWTGLMLVNFGGDFALPAIAVSAPS